VVPEDITISAYCISLNAAQTRFPIEVVVRNHLGFCNNMVVVDGGSKDGTWEVLEGLKEEFGDRLIIQQNEWNYNHPDMMGRQKSLARSLCKGQYCWQTDGDELLPEWQYDSVRKLIINRPDADIFDLPCLTFHGGMKSTALNENHYKWRLSKNTPGIKHGVPVQFRQYDEDGNMFFYRGDSDSCEYIWEHTGEIVKSTIMWDTRLYTVGRRLRDSQGDLVMFKGLQKIIADYANGTELPCVFHYSWVDYERKAGLERFWGQMKKYYKGEGDKPREFGKINKPVEEITDADIKKLTIKYYLDDIFPVDVKKHPEHILEWAQLENWNQSAAFV
jgi:glycosyltransferase involved in cell wall biosynthesis